MSDYEVVDLGGRIVTETTPVVAGPRGPAGGVSTVAGRTGDVTLAADDVGGLGDAATKDVGTTAGTVAAGDDARFAAGGGGGTPTVAFEVADGTGAASIQLFPSQTFAVVDYSTVVTNIGGGVWDGAAETWQVPTAGIYLCVARIRVADSTTNRGFGQGIHTATADGTWFAWSERTTQVRSTMTYTRVAQFQAGDLLRHFGYNTGAAIDITSASFTATLLAQV